MSSGIAPPKSGSPLRKRASLQAPSAGGEHLWIAFPASRWLLLRAGESEDNSFVTEMNCDRFFPVLVFSLCDGGVVWVGGK